MLIILFNPLFYFGIDGEYEKDDSISKKAILFLSPHKGHDYFFSKNLAYMQKKQYLCSRN